tara:strand:- start:1489 stop:1800 length:312 start_codon:yes stop_codon:yes gene_type:complete
VKWKFCGGTQLIATLSYLRAFIRISCACTEWSAQSTKIAARPEEKIPGPEERTPLVASTWQGSTCVAERRCPMKRRGCAREMQVLEVIEQGYGKRPGAAADKS